jgi:predicted acetyltransferase
MAKLDRMTAAPIEIEINNKKYFLSPLRVRDLGALEKWAEKKIFARLKDELSMIEEAGMEIDDIMKLNLINEASQKSRNQNDKSMEMQTVDGLRKILELSLSIKHSDITAEEVDEIIDGQGLEALNEVIEELSYPNEEETKDLKKD